MIGEKIKINLNMLWTFIGDYIYSNPHITIYVCINIITL